MRTMKPLMTMLGTATLLAATVVPAAAQDGADGPDRFTLRYAPLFLCDFGQPTGFDLAPCDADDDGLHLLFDATFEISGALDGIGAFSGVLTVRPDDTLGADAKAIFMGEVEGCGTGTVHISVADVEGYYDEDGVPIYTQNTWEIVPGGTLPVSGSFEGLGPETLMNDHSSGADFTGVLSCDEDDA